MDSGMKAKFREKMVKHFADMSECEDVLILQKEHDGAVIKYTITLQDDGYKLTAGVYELQHRPILMPSIHENQGFKTRKTNDSVEICSLHHYEAGNEIFYRMKRYYKFLKMVYERGNDMTTFEELFGKID